jgi:hypothetical protein
MKFLSAHDIKITDFTLTRDRLLCLYTAKEKEQVIVIDNAQDIAQLFKEMDLIEDWNIEDGYLMVTFDNNGEKSTIEWPVFLMDQFQVSDIWANIIVMHVENQKLKNPPKKIRIPAPIRSLYDYSKTPFAKM